MAKVVAVAALAAGAGCAGPRLNKIMADIEVLPYEAPDADEIAGVEEAEEPEEGEGSGSATTPGK